MHSSCGLSIFLFLSFKFSTVKYSIRFHFNTQSVCVVVCSCDMFVFFRQKEE